jgi:oligopeptide transport system ATP-binding protein
LSSTILEVKDLVTRFHTADGIVHAVNGVSFSLKAGSTLGIVGESGCGKSVTVLSMMRLIPEPPGNIERGIAVLDGSDLLKMTENELRNVRGNDIGMIFQDPMTSLNPVMRIGKQISESIKEHEDLSDEQVEKRVIDLLTVVGIPDPQDRLKDYPHQFSGGMRQRVMIAMALACNPKLLIADEPTTALDVTIQAQIIERIKELRDQFNMSVIWITHDLGIIAGLVDQVIVMYAGYVVERSDVWDIYAQPKHPYTIGLLESLPKLNRPDITRLANIEGRPPDLLREPKLCPFLPRCDFAIDKCAESMPTLRMIAKDHEAACWCDL